MKVNEQTVVDEITAVELVMLVKGDVFETGVPFEGIAPDVKLKFTVVHGPNANGLVKMTVTYFGVFVTDLYCKAGEDGKVKWMSLPDDEKKEGDRL